MSTALTPEDLYAKARHLRVDLAREPFLLPLIKQAVVTPLPPQWVQATDGDGATTVFRNQLTGELHETHPADAYFLKQIHELREYHERPSDSSDQHATAVRSPSSGWMEFVDPDHAYYHDFVSKATQRTRPKAPLADSASVATPVPQLTAATSKIFNHAASLHKTPSMKNLDALEILCFTSWWTESGLAGSKKSCLQLYFSIPTRHFQLALDASDDVYTISHVVGPSGRVVSAWDLHVGARIQLLGRWTTLMQPSLLTRQWLDLHEKQFQAMKRELEKELLKYEPASGHERKPMTGQIQCVDPHRSAHGVSLRQLLSDVETLKIKLAKFRPDVARRFITPFEANDYSN